MTDWPFLWGKSSLYTQSEYLILTYAYVSQPTIMHHTNEPGSILLLISH